MEQITIKKTKLTITEAEELIQELKEDGVIAEISVVAKITRGELKITSPDERFKQVTMDELEQDDDPEEDDDNE